MAGFLSTIKISEEAFNNAKETTVTKGFTVLESGAYAATVHQVILYKTTFKDTPDKEETALKIEVKLTDSGNIISFKDDVNKLRKDGTENEGFLARLKSLGIATGVDVDTFKMGEATIVHSYGKELKGQLVVGCVGKPVLALVKKMNNTSAPETDQFKYQNFLDGITRKGAEDVEVFNEKVAKLEGGVFNYKGYVKPEGSASTSATPAQAQDLSKVDF